MGQFHLIYSSAGQTAEFLNNENHKNWKSPEHSQKQLQVKCAYVQN